MGFSGGVLIGCKQYIIVAKDIDNPYFEQNDKIVLYPDFTLRFHFTHSSLRSLQENETIFWVFAYVSYIYYPRPVSYIFKKEKNKAVLFCCRTRCVFWISFPFLQTKFWIGSRS